MADPGFPTGVANLKGGDANRLFDQFYRKLHQNEEGNLPCDHHLDPPMCC